jgi:hypothetical protein
MSTGVANRIAALGVWALRIAEISGAAATGLIEHGIQPPIGSGNPIEVFTACGIGAFQAVLNADMMPEGVKMNAQMRFTQTPHYHQVALWENDSGNRRVVTVHVPEANVFLSIVQGGTQMVRPIPTNTPQAAAQAHNTLVAMVQAGQL